MSNIIEDRFAKESAFWAGKLNGEMEISRFPYDFKREKLQKYIGAAYNSKFSDEISEKLISMSNGSDYALYIILLAGVQFVLGKYLGVHDTMVVMPVFRQNKEVEALINKILLLRTDLGKLKSFKDLLVETKQVVTEANANQNFHVLSCLNVQYGENGLPVLNTVTLLDSIHEKGYLADMNTDILLNFLKKPMGLELNIEYNALLYKEETIREIFIHLSNFFDIVMKNRAAELDNVVIMTQEESEKIHSKLKACSEQKAAPKADLTREFIENKLLSILEKQLGNDEIGLDDDFFYDLGGNSLIAISFMSAVIKEFNVELSMSEIFSNPTIRNMAACISSAGEGSYSPIARVEEKEYYPVSAAQKRMYIINQIQGGGIEYNIPSAMIIEGAVDRVQLTEIFNKLVQRHEALRTSFKLEQGEPVQVVHENADFEVGYIEAQEDRVDSIIKEFVRPFDLSKAPLLRVALAKISEDRHVLMFDTHHIISDGMSMSVITREFIRLYEGKALPELRIQYKDFSEWQNELLKSEIIKKQEAYWLNIFAGELPVLNIPSDHPRPALQSLEGDEILFRIDRELALRLNSIVSKTGSTLYMLLLGAYITLLHKYTGQEDIIVGSPVAGRLHADLENIVGMFVNTLAMRSYPKPEKSFTEFLKEVRDNALNAFENQDYQFEKLVEKLDIPRDMSRNPLFDTLFVLQNIESSKLEVNNLKITPYQFKTGNSKFDMVLAAFETEDGIDFSFEYSTKLYKKERMQSLVKHFVNILKVVADNSDITLAEINMLSEQEKKQILYDFNNTKAEYQKEKTIHQLFEEQVEKTPDNTAVVFEDKVLTYRELNQKANQLAYILRKNGVKPDSIVGLLLERSLEMIIGIMAVLKAGGAYLPISPQYPKDRIDFMLEDSKAVVLLTHNTIDNGGGGTTPLQVINLGDEGLYSGDSSNLERVNESTDLAYVIYTSGSTGKPKGVMIEHYSLINRLNWMQKLYPLREGDVILQKTPYTFDVSVWELFWWAIQGAGVCFLKPGGERDPQAIVEAIEKNNVTTMHFVPSMLSAFLEHISEREDIDRLKSLRQVFASGEALTVNQVRKFNSLLYKKFNTKLHNLYGPTEATVDVSYFDCSTGEELGTIPIGKPIDNINLYILDKNNKLQPIGVHGELHIAGDGLARGYLNRPELTAEKFIPNPFAPKADPEHLFSVPCSLFSRMYKTGDLARWMPDGNIEYLGRLDHQVKIRGLRIELGEIEAELLTHESIKEAVVVARDDRDGNKYLCAYIVAHRELTVPELREYLTRKLSDYMIPSYFVQLDHMPMTPNGKLDRKSLPEPDRNINTGVSYVAPGSDVEKKLAEIYQAVLGVDRVGINDSIFDLGGDSIKAIQVTSAAEQQGINIMVSELLRYKTISELVKNVDYKKEKKAVAQDEVKGKVLLTPVQQWFFELDRGYRHYWNQTNLFSIKEDTDLKLLEDVLGKIMEHHDALRMGVRFEGETVEQFGRGMDEIQFSMEVTDLSQHTYEIQQQKIKETSEKIQDSLNLEKDLLIRACVFELGQNGKRLLIAAHHLVIDGVSWRILMEDIEKLYNSRLEEELPLKTTSFKEWSQKLNNYAEQNLIDTAYWENINCSKIKTLSKAPLEENYLKDHESLDFVLDEEHTGKLLTQVNKAYGTEINDILLSALTMAVTEAAQQDNVLLMMEGYGREEIIEGINLSRTVGWFTSIYPVYLEKQENIQETIAGVKQSLRKIPSKGINYGIARYIKTREKLKALKPEISFNYLGQFNTSTGSNSGLLLACTEEYGMSVHPNNRHDYLIDINGFTAGGRLHFSIKYNTRYIAGDLARKISELFEKSLISIIVHCMNKLETSLEQKNSNLYQINEPGKKELKVVVHNEITAYLCHSLPISVILADERLHPWFHEHYMEIFSKTDENGRLYLEFIEVRAAYSEVIQEVYMGYELLEGVPDIIDYVIHKINLGYYVIIHVDEYYLLEKRTYRKEHYVHHSLVYGYDNAQRKLKAIGFNAQHMFTNISFEYDSFREGYESGKLHYKDSAPWAATNAIELLRLKDYKYEYPFDREKFLARLKRHIDSKGDFSVVYSLWLDKQMFREHQVKYGLQIYDDVIHHLYNLMQGKFTVDYRAMHVLFEHKKAIYKRLLYIISKYGISGRLVELTNKYHGIMEMVDAARRIFFEHAITGDDTFYNPFPAKEALEQMIEILSQVKNKERLLLTDIYEELKLELFA